MKMGVVNFAPDSEREGWLCLHQKLKGFFAQLKIWIPRCPIASKEQLLNDFFNNPREGGYNSLCYK